MEVQLSNITSDIGCGALTSMLLSRGREPSFTNSISLRMFMRASQNRSSSSKDSDSVGSIMRVFATGQLIVGLWNLKDEYKPAEKSQLPIVEETLGDVYGLNTCRRSKFSCI